MDRLRWHARALALDSQLLTTLAAHVEHWRVQLNAYDLLVPLSRAVGLQIYGELWIHGRAASRGDIDGPLAVALEALSELTTLVPDAQFTVMSDDVVFEMTVMGFARRPRRADDASPTRPDGWVPVATRVEPVVLPPPGVIQAPGGPRDLDALDDVEAASVCDAVMIRAAALTAFLAVAELRDRPRSEVQQVLYDAALSALGVARIAGAAPTLVLALECVRSEATLEAIWREAVTRAVANDERTHPDVAAVTKLLASPLSTFLSISAERRAVLRALEAEHVVEAKELVTAFARWMADNRERIDELAPR